MMIRRYASYAILLVALAAPAKADPASEALLRSFFDGIAADPAWFVSLGLIRSDGDDTIAEGVTIRNSESEASIGIERLRVSALLPRDGGGFTASEIAIDGASMNFSMDIEGVSQSVEYSVPAGSVQDVSVPATGGFAFDPDKPMRSIGEFYTLIAQAEFSDFSIPEMSGSQTSTPPGDEGPAPLSFVYRNIKVAGMSGGVMGASEFGPFSFDLDLPAASGGSLHFEIEKASSGEADIGALARIVDPRAYENGRGDGVWHSIVSEVVYSGISATGAKGQTFRLERIGIRDMEGRQPDEPMADAFDRMIANPEDVDPATIKSILSFYSAGRIGEMRVDGMAFDAPEAGGSFGLDSLAFAGLSGEGFDSLTLSNLRGAGPEGFASFDEFEMRGFVFPDLATFIDFGMKADKSPDSQPSVADIRTMMNAMPQLAHFGLHGLAAGMSEAEAVTIGSFTLDTDGWNGLSAETAELLLSELHIPRELILKDPRTAEPFRALGLERLVLGLSASTDWAIDVGSYDLTIGMSVEGGAEIEIALSVTGITNDWVDRAIEASQMEENDAIMMGLFAELSVDEATITIDDDTLVDRSFDAAIVAQGLDVDAATYKQQTRDAVPFLLSTVVPPALVERIGAPVQSFLEGGRTLVVHVAPPQPMMVGDIMAALGDPVALVDALQLSITTE